MPCRTKHRTKRALPITPEHNTDDNIPEHRTPFTERRTAFSEQPNKTSEQNTRSENAEQRSLPVLIFLGSENFCSKSSRTHLEIVSKLSRTRLELISKSPRNRLKLVSKSSRNRLEIVSNSSRNCLELVSNLSRARPEPEAGGTYKRSPSVEMRDEHVWAGQDMMDEAKQAHLN